MIVRSLLILAGLLATPVAEAGTIPEPGFVGSTLGPGSFLFPVTLTKGRDYALVSASDVGFDGNVVLYGGPDHEDPVLAIPLCGEDEGVCGRTFRAPANGTYVIDVNVTSTPGTFVGGFWVAVPGDCAGDRSTLCHIEANETLYGRAINYTGDVDRFRTRLRGGRTYVVTRTFEPGEGGDPTRLAAPLRILDRSGHVLAQAPDPGSPLRFRARQDGDAWIESADAFGATVRRYSLQETVH
jgi:hypothetical protein